MDEDMIMPDDFETTPSEEVTEDIATDTESIEEVVEDTTETTETTEEVQEQTEQAKEEARKLKIKYNHQELELGEDEAIPLIQKGMNYDKALEKLKALETDPRLSFVEELANENNMTVSEYLEAVKAHKEQQKLNELIQSNIPEEYAKEILENRKFREQLENQNKTKAQEEKQQQDFREFLEVFPDVNATDIPPEVWKMAENGVPLKFAYMQVENQKLQNELKILKQNQENKKKAPIGGVTQHGSKENVEVDDFMKGFLSI